MHSFFIHPSFDGSIGRFHISATVNSAALNICRHASFHIAFRGSFDKHPDVESLGPALSLELAFFTVHFKAL